MDNFTYNSPTKIVFGRGSIAELGRLLGGHSRVMLVYGQGSIKKNGVYDQIQKALKGHSLVEFSGVEANPRYETCMRAVELARQNKVDFILAAGGGSVLDGSKFIAAALCYRGQDPWDILQGKGRVEAALPIGSVLTLPATGSESNGGSVMSRESSREKLFFVSDLVRPVFAVLDPETTFSLPDRQTANGIVDAYVHVMEQYATYPADCPLQDRQAEAILLTLIENAPRVFENREDYQARATIMWCATQALNGLIGCGAPQDWATHMIGHELTALYGLDHAQTLAVVLPGVLEYRLEKKMAKLAQYAWRVWGISERDSRKAAILAISRTEEFFSSIGVKTRLGNYEVPQEACRLVAERLAARGARLGEHQDILPGDVEKILSARL